MSVEHEPTEDNSEEKNILQVTVFEARGDSNGGGCLITMSALMPAYIASLAIALEGFQEGKLDKAAFGAIVFASTYVASRRVDAAHQRIVKLEASSKNSSNAPLR